MQNPKFYIPYYSCVSIRLNLFFHPKIKTFNAF